LTAGIDAGSRAIKAALYDVQANRIRDTAACDQGLDQAERAEQLLRTLLERHGIARRALQGVVATGYGRHAIAAAADTTTITEITCHACGVHHLHPEAATLIDIGGQDSKLVHLAAGGRVRDFAMNDRCAAGTGRFLEVVAQRLGVPLDGLGALAAAADRPAAISSMCVVFAETEIIGLLAARESPANIVAGVQQAIAGRVAAMAGGRVAEPVIFTGGVALVSGMAAALAAALHHPVRVAADPRMTGAIGAAILAVSVER
jgi:predicted CoA-substrate-specific enzyme activase